ncbi:uncharacterized protein BYT42DRAFT_615017 [Radiomyces spectabilis]|uniref:uncharacterized protein n=1 Tax=Radiomyces spectabilis TaxID=64574 RepID=UPI00221FFE85|nr:uncharacterized protein BYT42DRAFT_615017 [Radiomyces spectabilis]KAI8376249.1 hypothetical protein BYT42DRAFT_615017 [Radiomyces spectabilis]
MDVLHNFEYPQLEERYEEMRMKDGEKQILNPVRSFKIEPHMTNGDSTVYQPHGTPSCVFLSGLQIGTELAVDIIRYYCFSLASSWYHNLGPLFTFSPSGGGYRCTLKLPSSAPFVELSSDVEASELVALNQVVLSACTKLYSLNVLDDILSHLQQSSLIYIPNFWMQQRQSLENIRYKETLQLMNRGISATSSAICQLYMSIISLEFPDRPFNQRRVRRLCLFTWEPLPISPSFTIPSGKNDIPVSIQAIKYPLIFTKGCLEILANATIALLSVMTQHDFFCLVQNFPYFMAPLTSYNGEPIEAIESIDEALAAVDWIELVNMANAVENPISTEEFQRILDLPNDGRLFNTLFRRLSSASKDSLLPEMPGSISWFPHILHKLEHLLLLDEVRKKFRAEATDRLLLEAFTTERAGEAYDYQRLELLGDTVLRVAAAVWVYVLYPSNPKDDLNFLYEPMQTNKYLERRAVQVDLGRYVANTSFFAQSWKPFVFAMRANYHLKDTVDSIPRPFIPKQLADIVESSIGAVYVSNGMEASFKYMAELGIFRRSPFDRYFHINDWTQLILQYHDRCMEFSDPPTPELSKDITQLQTTSAYHFNYQQHLYPILDTSRGLEDNREFDRFMFLGRIVLQILIVKYAFFKYQTFGPHKLTQFKDHVLDDDFFAKVFYTSGLPMDIGSYNALFKSSVVKAARLSGALAMNVMEALKRQFPIMLERFSNILQALFGAAYVDAGFQVEPIEHYILHHIEVFPPFMMKYRDFTPEQMEHI